MAGPTADSFFLSSAADSVQDEGGCPCGGRGRLLRKGNYCCAGPTHRTGYTVLPIAEQVAGRVLSCVEPTIESTLVLYTGGALSGAK